MTQSGTAQVYIGADVLEIMSVAMYAEPLVIYRELVQNAADSIESAILAKLISADMAKVRVSFDQATRTASCYDNGAGLSNDLFDAQMLSFGASGKRATSFRGFRGIGRLAGLGQCKNLVFRSRAKGDKFVREATWSAIRLRELLASKEIIELQELARESVSLREFRATDEESHFFEVRLEGLRRLGDDRLFDPHRISAFLGEVAPVPFSTDFRHGSQIREELLRRGPLLELELTVADKLVVKPYREVIEARAGRNAKISEIEFVELPALNSGTAAYGWIAHHDYFGALRRDSPGRGLRVRSGNLQIGDENILAQAFPEERFNSWTVGEFHVFDAHLRPNARRDAFEPSLHVDNLYNQLRPHAASIARRCRNESKQRNCSRRLMAVSTELDSIESTVGRELSPFSATLRKMVGTTMMETLAELTEDVKDERTIEEIARIKARAIKLSRRGETKAPSARERGRLDVLSWLHHNANPDLFSEAVRAMRKIK